MRILSSLPVVERAEAVVRKIVETFFAQNTTFPEFRELVQSHTIDLLRPFPTNVAPNCRHSPIAERYFREPKADRTKV